MKNPYPVLGVAALLVLASTIVVASCDSDDGTVGTNDCGMSAGRSVIAPAALAKPTSKAGRSSVDEPVRRPSVRVSKKATRPAPQQASPRPSKSSSHRRNHIDIDLDLDGC